MNKVVFELLLMLCYSTVFLPLSMFMLIKNFLIIIVIIRFIYVATYETIYRNKNSSEYKN